MDKKKSLYFILDKEFLVCLEKQLDEDGGD